MDNLEQIVNTLNFASLGWQIGATLIFILSDIVTGVISALIQKNLDSQKMREGLLRKILLIIVVILGFIIEYAFKMPYVSKVVCIYIVVMETISMLENMQKAGIELGRLGDLLKIKPDENTVNLVIKKDVEEKKENE